MKENSTDCVLIIVILSLTNPALGRNAPSVRWGYQFPGSSLFSTMTADSNDGIYVAMRESSQDDSGTEFMYHHLIKYSPDGKQLWRKHVGTREAQQAKRLHVDGLAADDYGNIYAFGTTNCQLGQTIVGDFDAFVIKYDSSGNQQQVWQLGTPKNDRCHGLAIDGDQNLYLVGATTGSFAKTNQGCSDIIIAAYDKQGTVLWKDQIGSKAEDFGVDLCLGDSNDIYILGSTSGVLADRQKGDLDFVVARYDRSGNPLWLRQYGTEATDDIACIEMSEQNHVYVGGHTKGSLAFKRAQRGYGDAFIMKIADTGEALWTRQFGSRGWDKVWHMARFKDGSGDILAGGCQYPLGKCQAFCRRYSSEGTLIWTKTFGKLNPQAGTCGRAVAIDSTGNCYHSGFTGVGLFDDYNGRANLFIVSIKGMPEK